MAAPAARESHLRSILKGITWRLVASADTFVVAFLVTWVVNGEPSVEVGLKIAGVEFFLKLAIYYVHERIWQFAWKDGVVTTRETLFKSISWRVTATLTTFIIALFVLDQGPGQASLAGVAGAIAAVEVVTKFLLYFLHERIWLMIPLGTVRQMMHDDEPQ